MNLYLKIKECVDNRGAEIIISNTLVGILDDEQVFNTLESRPYKGILRNIIKEGYAQRLLDLGGYTSEIECMAYQYAQRYLTQQDSIQYIFDCLAYGLGWIDREPNIKQSGSKVNGDVVEPVKDNLSIPTANSKQRSLLNDLFTTFNKKKMFLFASIVLVILGCLFLHHYINQVDTESKIEDYREVLNNLPGNYTLKEYKDDIIVGRSKTAVLRNNSSMYTFTIVTDFGPENHSFITTSNNLVRSETLGEGEITYKEIINKTTITFKKDNYLWVFVK